MPDNEKTVQGNQRDYGMQGEILVAVRELVNMRIAETREEMRIEMHEMHRDMNLNSLTGRQNEEQEKFHKVAHYLSMLIEVSSKTDHKVHDEMAEAIKQLKELAYTERA